MTKKVMQCIAKFIDYSNRSWNWIRFFYRMDDTTIPALYVSSSSADVLSLVSAIVTLFCGVVVVNVSDSESFCFKIF